MTSRRVTAARVAFATWLVAACTAPAPLPLPSARRPNVVVFLVDDLGTQETSVPFQATASALNKVYRTPAVERLAAEGVKFPQAYASAVCSPTRISLLTGMNVARHGVTSGYQNCTTAARRRNAPRPKKRHPSGGKVIFAGIASDLLFYVRGREASALMVVFGGGLN